MDSVIGARLGRWRSKSSAKDVGPFEHCAIPFGVLAKAKARLLWSSW